MTIDISTPYAATGTAKLAHLPTYETALKTSVPSGAVVTITSPGPVWPYLRLAHTLHGIALTLTYDSAVTGPVGVFDRNPH